MEKVSAPVFDTAVEITMVRLLARFKGVICKNVIILLLVVGLSLLLQTEGKIPCCLVFYRPPPFLCCHSSLPVLLNPFIFHLLPAPLKDSNKPYKMAWLLSFTVRVSEMHEEFHSWERKMSLRVLSVGKHRKKQG